MLKTRLIIVGLALAIVAGMALFIALLWVRLPGRSAPPKIQNTATILQQIQTLSELVTVKYVLEKVVILEDIKWYGENRVLLLAHGIVKAGVDLKEAHDDVNRLLDGQIVEVCVRSAREAQRPPVELVRFVLFSQGHLDAFSRAVAEAK